MTPPTALCISRTRKNFTTGTIVVRFRTSNAAGLVSPYMVADGTRRMPVCHRAHSSTASHGCDTFAAQVEESATFPRLRPARPLSETFWQLDLSRRLPLVLTRDGIEATSGCLDRIRGFLVREFPTLTEEGLGTQLSAGLAQTKHWYLGNACDLIELQHRGNTIGAIIGAPDDWSSYYVRIFAVSPAYQRPALTRRFGRECLLDPLAAHGIQRVVAETSPANLPMSRGLCELRFHVTGHHLSERYGPLVRYTKFLDPESEAAFNSRFAGSAPPRKSRPKQQKGGRGMKRKFALATA
jgi:hypothetical protein